MPESGVSWSARVAAAMVDLAPDWGSLVASQAIGAAARARIPRGLSRAVVQGYVRAFGVDLHDVDPTTHAEGYNSFDEFFTRRLRPGARPIARASKILASPCDGLMRSVVTIDSTTDVLAKGHRYSLGELLADESLAAEFQGGSAATIYLHPRDYHRVHTPCDALVESVSVVPGRLLPVTAAALNREPRLFALNERMIHVLDTVHGKLAVVMIAAFGVGHMTCSYRHLTTHPSSIVRRTCEPPARLRKGDELGVFHLGSTVVMIMQEGVHSVMSELPVKVQMGQAILEGRGDV